MRCIEDADERARIILAGKWERVQIKFKFDSPYEAIDMADWLDTHGVGEFLIEPRSMVIYFSSREDAALYKLTWG